MNNRKPLEGIRVVDLSQVASGPFGTMVLAEQGADVVKIEPIAGGEMIRYLPNSRSGVSAEFMNLNRGKRSIALDLNAEAGRNIVLDLIAEADVVVQNFRPGVVDRLGVGYGAAKARRSDIVYVSISGYGSSGPYSDRPVYDPVIQGLTGAVARQQSETIPIPDLVRNIMFDKATALNVAQGVCAALVARSMTGEGDHLEIAMLDVGVHFFWPDGMSDYTLVGDGASTGFRIADMYRVTHCADGQLIYFAATDEQIHGLYRALGRPDLIDDDRFATPEARVSEDNIEVLGAIIEAAFADLPMRETLDKMHANGVPAGPINEPDDVLTDPQIVHNETLVTWEHPTYGTLRQPRHPIKFSGEALPVPEFVDGLGERTDEILGELGRTAEQIAALRESGVVA